MKTAPAFDAVVGQSHAVATLAELRAPDGTPIGPLPITAGRVTGSVTTGLDVWRGQLDIADLSWAPKTASDPLSPLSGNYVSIQRAVQPYGQQQTWVEVARLWLEQTSVTVARGQNRLSVQLVGPAVYADRAGDFDYSVQAGETCQVMARRVLLPHLPYTPQVLDTSTPTPAPIGATWEDTQPGTVVEDLMAVTDARAYFDALGRLVIRPRLDELTLGDTAQRHLSTDQDVVSYTLTMTRAQFANEVQVRFGDSSKPNAVTDGGASITGGPLRVGGPAGRLVFQTSRDVEADQVAANAYAFSLLKATELGWVIADIEAVQDPRLEPWDTFDATYLGMTLRHRVKTVALDLGTGSMRITAATRVPDGTTNQQAQATTHSNPHAGGKP